jgi:hypothetical protein
MRQRLAVIIDVVVFALGAIASEKAVKLKDLPPAVQKAVQEQTKGAELKGLAKEVEKGKTFYEAETMVNGRTRDLLFDDAGDADEKIGSHLRSEDREGSQDFGSSGEGRRVFGQLVR